MTVTVQTWGGKAECKVQRLELAECKMQRLEGEVKASIKDRREWQYPLVPKRVLASGK